MSTASNGRMFSSNKRGISLSNVGMYDAVPLAIPGRTKADANRLLMKKLSFNLGSVKVLSREKIPMISTRRSSLARFARRRLKYFGVPAQPIDQ